MGQRETQLSDDRAAIPESRQPRQMVILIARNLLQEKDLAWELQRPLRSLST
jgi:hypothetical protein